MRGYLSFILLFLILGFISSFYIFSERYYEENNENLIIRKTIAHDLNIKETIIILAKKGKEEGRKAALALISAGKLKPEDADEFVEEFIFEKLKKMPEEFNMGGFKVRLWCSPKDGIAFNLAKREMEERGRLAIPIGATGLHNQICKEYIQYSFPEDRLLLGKRKILQKGVIGYSIYSKKFGIGKIGYIPSDERVFE